MDSQVNTGGGAAVSGDVNAGRDVVGRDQTINNIVVLSNFLHYAHIEGIFPKIQEAKDFNSLTEAVESALGSRLNSDLAEATAFAGEILGYFVLTQIPSDPRQPISLKTFLSSLIGHICQRLKATGHWDAYSQLIYLSSYGVRLEATVMLWNKQFSGNRKREIWIDSLDLLLIDGNEEIAKLNTRELRVVIAGIVLDLIRIGSDARITTEFLKSMAEQFSPSNK